MSLTQFWATLRAAGWSMLLMTVVATSVAYYLVSGLPKQYTAKARVMLNIDNPDPTQYSALKRDTEASYIGTEMRLVTDDAITRDVVAKLGWAENPQVITAWQEATGSVGDVTTWAAQQIGQAINVQQLEDSSIIEIYYSSSSLDAAKQIVALIRTAYIDQSLRLRADAARRASAWNRTQATKALAEVRAAEAARAKFVTANQIAVDTPVGGLDYQAQETALINSTAHMPTTVAAGEPAEISSLRRQLNGLDAELAVVQLQGEANPATQSLIARRATVAQQLARETAVTQAGPGATEAQIGLVRAQRDADYLQTRLRLIARAPLYDTLATMDRDVVLKVQRYNAAAARVADFDTVAAAPSGLKVIGDVIADDAPSFPNIPLTLAIAACSSFALAAALALVGDLVRRQVRGAEDLRFFAQVPVLAVIADDPPRRRLRSFLTRMVNRRTNRTGAVRPV